jgi:glycosyltransferase involved in cell wall biosynthesis
VIAGDFPIEYLVQWFAYAVRLGIRDSTIFTGRLTNSELRDVYAAADVFLYPSFAEGLGLPVVEACAGGLPTVVSDIPVFRETVGDMAIFVDPRDIAGLAEGCMRGLRRERDATAGTRITERFSWQRFQKQHLALYKAAVGETAASGAAGQTLKEA